MHIMYLWQMYSTYRRNVSLISFIIFLVIYYMYVNDTVLRCSSFWTAIFCLKIVFFSLCVFILQERPECGRLNLLLHYSKIMQNININFRLFWNISFITVKFHLNPFSVKVEQTSILANFHIYIRFKNGNFCNKLKYFALICAIC